MCNQFKNSNEEINRIIGNYFLDDSRSFLSRYNLLIETATDKGRRCKLLVDMLFSIECSLKALLFFESKADEKVTYKKVKRIGHKLNNLFNEQDISKYSKINEYYNQIKSIGLNDYEIHLRYTLESHIKFDPCYEKKINPSKEEEYYKMVEELMITGQIYNIAKGLLDIVEELHPTKFVTIKFSDIDIEKELEAGRRISDLKSI